MATLFANTRGLRCWREQYGGKNLIVLWAPGGQNRPYKAPRDVTARHKEYHYYKHQDRAEATRFFNYPFPAVEEVLVNAVYHRSYEQPEPVEVRVNPDCIEVVSYPGPDASIRIEALDGGRIVARRYRNRRLGEFLKELKLTEGRCTGIPKIRSAMSHNGSPPAQFSTDEQRTHFLVVLPVHPNLPGVAEAHEGAHDEAHEGLNQTEQTILAFLQDMPKDRTAIAKRLGVTRKSGSLGRALTSLKDAGLIEFTIPDKPNSKNQKYRATPKAP